MKRGLLLFIFFIAFSGTLSAQNIVPKNYRSLSECEQDTIAYLNHNWGVRSSTDYEGKTVGDFLKDYELPIVDIKLSVDQGYNLFSIRLYFKSYEWIQKNAPTEYDKFQVCLLLSFNPDHWVKRLKYVSTFRGLAPAKDVVYPWREEYRELMKDWVLEDVQYNYGIFGEE